jgi:putative peptidoglycan lipid II flippase
MKKRYLFHRAGTTVALMIGATLVSKVLGMLRQVMTAGIFGASMEGIAFSAASGIPLAIFDMLFSAAVLGSFLPIYKGHLCADGKRARAFSSSFFTVVFLLTALVSALGILFARQILRLAAPDLCGETLSLAVTLLRVMFPSMIFAGVTYILVGILQSHERFLLPSFVSAISNLFMLSYLALSQTPLVSASAVGLAVMYLLSWVLQFLTLAIPLLRKGEFPVPSVQWRTPDTVLAVKRALPVMLGSWLVPMTTLLAKAFSSFAKIETEEAGAAIVVYENAFAVFSIATGLLTYGICNYTFPKLSVRFAQGNTEAFSQLIRKGFFSLTALILPVSGALFLLSGEVTELLYLRGNFTETLASATGESLRILALAMPAYGALEFFSRVCYACARVRYPMWASLAGIGVSFSASALFLSAGNISPRAVAVSVLLGQIAAGGLLLIFSLRFLEAGNKREWLKYFFMLVGAVVSMLAMHFFRAYLRQALHFFKTFQNFFTIVIVFTVGFMVYSIWLVLTGTVRITDFRTVDDGECTRNF